MIHSSITQTNCFDEIHAATKDLPKDALVIFDIDDVLITAKDHVLRGQKKEKWLNEYFDNRFSPEEVLQVSSHVWTVYETEITDAKVVELNESLKERGIPSIALTAGWNGSLGHRPLHCDDRVDILKGVGIDFSHSFPTIKETFFRGFENCTKIPSFKKGVIFACMLPKQDILGAFLASVNYTPKTIVFVDDMLINLERL
ncbi:MAG: DUF2608 domain-containing protein, partial [Alphaproteobacteria bacterium]|nr:DUF2608 domain-containing protein [Alphaproteobacteria bacterium]